MALPIAASACCCRALWLTTVMGGGALQGQCAQLAVPVAPRPARRGAGDITAVDHALLARLAHDGRASRQALSTDPPTVERGVEQLTRFGVSVATSPALGGWPVAITCRAKVPLADLPAVGRALIRPPETRSTRTAAPRASARPTSGPDCRP
ncbi:hypothetical protein ABT187_36725 [Streptomyces sp. NPDC001817]|uniref:hypothetical protein n=1 Tax=Streptomyces sp. NPDC001817 TaxID=3154398 RepID=UPI003322DF3E